MEEWKDKYNPFNSLKVLVHRDHFQKCIRGEAWPKYISLDPSNKCNLRCAWCNSRTVIGNDEWDIDTIDIIIDLIRKWGINAVCIGGGGESTTCSNFGYLINRLWGLNVKMGLTTNGLLLKNHAPLLHRFSWVAVSMDAGNSAVYKQEKGVDRYADLLDNLLCLAENKGVQKETKFLLTTGNYKSIYDFCKVSACYGMDFVHIRPGSAPHWNQTSTDFLYTDDMIMEIEDQVARARRDFESKKFRIYSITHKFNPHLRPENNFLHCYAPYVSFAITADGWVDLCVCQRGKYRLCHISNIESCWMKKYHRDMVDMIKPALCPSCTFTHINEMIENVILTDRMGVDFL